MPKNISLLILSIGICLGAGFLSSFFTISAIPDWYQSLNKPFFSPPNWIFAPVWTILYILMGISLYIVRDSTSKIKRRALNLFFIQLFLNFIWSIIFFGMKNPLFALIDIILLWFAVFFTIKSFYKISVIASNLLVPNLLWISFASVLNLMIVVLN